MLYFLVNLVTFYLWTFLLLCVHECGHVLMAYLLRYRIFSVRLGYGKRLFLGEIREVSIEVNAIPLIGLTQALPVTRSLWRLRQWLYVLGGPLTHALFLLAAYLAFPESFYLGYVLPKVFSQFAPLEAFVIANLLLLIMNLAPYTLKKAVGTYQSDGLQLLKLPFAKDEMYDEFERVVPRLEAITALHRGDFAKAVRLLEVLLEKDRNNNMVRHDLAVAKLGLGDVPDARQLFTELLDAEEFNKPELRPILLNNIAWASAVDGNKEYLEIADKCSKEALDSNPTFAIFIGTRGTVLVYLGRTAEGISLLKKSYRQHSIPESRAAAALFIALGYAMSGDRAAAQKWLEKARSNAPGYWLIPRISDEISDVLRPLETK